MLPTDIAYCAGIIDGEGCIRIKKSKAYRCQGRATPGYHASIQVKMVERSALELLAATFGGNVRQEKRQEPGRRPLFVWSITDQKAGDACRILLPYLRVKRAQAELAIRHRELQGEGAKHRTKVIGFRNFPNKHGTPRQVPNLAFSDEYVSRCEASYLESRQLNRVGLWRR